MRLHRMTVTAFGPFGTAQHIDFDALSEAGLFLLHGPTGAGKTSVLDAVCFALYGSVPGARQTPGTTLRSDHAGDRTPTEVVLDLTLGGRRLEITRRPAQPRPKARGTGFTTERAVSGLREYDARTGEWSALSRSHQEIGEEISRLVGMSREQFCQVVLLPQGDFARFLRADAESRGRLLGRLFDTRRFAAVEERLAEQRRAAEAEVRTGDERLLALAHRMEQAAGAAARARPLPDRGPGDPGLAAGVLDWAAVARTDAREERDIAALRARAAEERQAGARAALDAARETARLQRRHAETLHRSAVLEEGRAHHEELLAREDRARRAERVLPALRLRDEAERADRAARAARDHSRAALPEDLTGADTERLTARERALRQELGGLDAARREEARGAELEEERAGLDRRSRADEDALHEASAWLAGWEALRRTLTDRIAAAQEAATRAEYLAGRLGTARDRLAAACERDELAARAARAETRLRALHERANTARSHWLDLKERRLLGIAAELAAALTPGTPCTVCGSPAHPSPARPTSDHVDRAAEDRAYEASVHAEAERAEAERELAVLHESRTASATRARAAVPGADRADAGHVPGPAPAGAAPVPDPAAPGAESMGAVPGVSGRSAATAGRDAPAAGPGAGAGGEGFAPDRADAGRVSAPGTEVRPGDATRATPCRTGTGPDASAAASDRALGTSRPGSDTAGGAAGAGGGHTDDAVPAGHAAGPGATGDRRAAGAEGFARPGPGPHAAGSGTALTAGDDPGADPSAPRAEAAGGDDPAGGRSAPEARDGAPARARAGGPQAGPGPSGGVPAPRGHDGGPTAEELRSLVDTLTREHAEARRAAGDMLDARAALERGERERSERVEAQRAAGERIAARNDRREALDRELARIEGEVARARGESGSVAARARLLEQRVAQLAEAVDAVRAADESARRLTAAEEAVAEAAASAGFASPADAAAAALPAEARRDARARIDAWFAESAAVAERLAEEDARAAAGGPPVDLTGAEAASAAADRALREAASRLDAARERCAALDRLTREAVDEVRRLGPLRERYDRVARLAGLTAGTSADNERKMRLESYVLAARLEQVAAAATVRLRRMSSGRYTLVHSDARAGGRRAGLGLHVVDAWTGRERDTATLSGGETFFVSLALALGLADVVTDEAGGMRLDTLFIDEGFGSLDEQTLDEVLDVLDSLRERDRSVGIVSHVGDLRRRIPVQLEVAKSRSGSAVRLLTAGAADALSG